MTTAIDRNARERIRTALESKIEDGVYVSTPDGYERLQVTQAGKAWHVPMLLQYWRKRRNVEWFKNFETFEEWLRYVGL